MPRLLRWALSSAMVLSIAGCKQTAQPSPQKKEAAAPTPLVKAVPQTPLAVKKDELGAPVAWDASWNAALEQSIQQDLLGPQAARAVRSYCPKFANESDVDKRAFWAYFFQALSAAEAGLKPTADVHHTEAAVAKIDKVTHRPIRQEGLLQLTYEDAARYECDFDWEHDRRLPEHSPEKTILNPQRNLSCGEKIVENQIITQGKPLIVRSSYWSTLQPGTVSYRVFAKQMVNVPAACGVRMRADRRRH